MTYFLLILLGISFCFIIFDEFSRKSTALVLWGGLFVFFYIPHTVEIIVGPEEYKLLTYDRASLFSLFFNIIYLVSRNVFSKLKIRFRIHESNSVVNDNLLRNLFLLLIISLLCLVYFVLSTFGSFYNFTWIDIFDFRGGISYTIYSYLFSMCIPLLFLAFKYKKSNIFIITMVIILFISIVFRIRAYLIPITVPFVLNYFFNENFKLTLFSLVKGILFSFLVVGSIFVLGVVKVYGTLDNFISTINITDFFDSLYFLFFSKYGELGLRNGFYFYIENENRFSNFGLGLGYLRLFLLPIPSQLAFGLKPQDFAMDMAMAYDPINSTPGVNSMHPTLYGDCFANFGWYGILLGIFWALFAYVADKIGKISDKNIFNLSLFVSYSYAFTLIARGAVYNGVYNVFFVFFTYRIMLIFIKNSIKYKV